MVNQFKISYIEGRVFYAQGEFEKALKIFKKLSKQDPQSLDYLFAVGRTFSRLNNDKKAIFFYDKVLNLQPNNFKALLGKVSSLIIMGRDQDALEIIDYELTKDDNPILLAKKGQILSSTEKNDVMIFDFFSRAIELKDDEPYIWILKSLVHEHYLEEDKALESLEKALSFVSESKTDLDQDNHISMRDVLVEKITTLRNFNYHEKALKCCEILLKRYKNDREALYQKIIIYYDQQEYDLALEVLDIALKIDPKNVYFLNLKGRIYYFKKSPEAALKIYDEITEIDPSFEWGWANKVSIHYYREEYQLAEKTAKKTLDIYPKNSFALYWGSLALRRLDKNSLAREWESRLSDPDVDTIFLEKNLQERLANELWRLKKFDYNLKLKNREYVLKDRRRIDLLCEDLKNGDLVVIELKVVPATRETFYQISHYMDSISRTIGINRKVKGIVISLGYNKDFKKLVNERSDISQLDYARLGL